MKILYLASKYKPEYYNGTIKFIENITQYFSKDNEVKLITYSDSIPEVYDTWNKVKYWTTTIDSINCLKFNIDDKNKSNYELYNDEIYKFALKIIKEYNPDIIHITHTRRVSSFIEAAINLKKKYIITLTDSFMVCPKTFLVTESCQICNKRHQTGICKQECGFDEILIKQNFIYAQKYFNNAYALITPSHFQSQIYEEYFRGNLLTINHGNNFTKVKIANQKYPKNKLIFGFNGSSIALKGLNVVIAAFNELEKDNECNVELHVHGFCDDTIRLIAGENIKFCGEYDNKEIHNILKNIDVLICPSVWYENYPFVITESFANGVPVIATNEGGMKELVKNFVNGFTFELGNVSHLVQIIKFLFYNQNIICKLRENLKEYKSKTVAEEMQEYLEIYYNAINDIVYTEKKYTTIDYIWRELIKNKYGDFNIEEYIKCIDKILEKHNYIANIDMKYRFIVRLKNMENILKQENKKDICIWGAGTSGKLTIDIIKTMYKWIHIKNIVDKHKYGQFIGDILIKDISSLEKNDYIFICTYPGKKEAENKMREMKKIINIDYNYGICVE